MRPTNREIRWMKHIERHGPQSSQYLYELTRDTHRCKDTALRQMQKLRAGGFLMLPHQQRATEHADFNPYIYDLTKNAKDHLFDIGIAESTVRPTGHWWHGSMTSCVTSSIEIVAARDGVRYIPTNEILAIKDVPLAIPVGYLKLIPDQLFALDYGGRFRAFALEVDRGTEPKFTRAKRKSLSNSIDLYRKLIERQIHKSHYGLKVNLLVLWLFSSRTNEARFLEMLTAVPKRIQRHFLTQSLEGRRYSQGSADLLSHLYRTPWKSSLEDEAGISLHHQ